MVAYQRPIQPGPTRQRFGARPGQAVHDGARAPAGIRPRHSTVRPRPRATSDAGSSPGASSRRPCRRDRRGRVPAQPGVHGLAHHAIAPGHEHRPIPLFHGPQRGSRLPRRGPILARLRARKMASSPADLRPEHLRDFAQNVSADCRRRSRQGTASLWRRASRARRSITTSPTGSGKLHEATAHPLGNRRSGAPGTPGNDTRECRSMEYPRYVRPEDSHGTAGCPRS